MEESVIIPIPQGSGSVPVPSRVDRADFVDKIKPEQVCELLRHKLLGEEWDGGKWNKIPALQNTSIIEVGAWEISNVMLGAGSLSVSISKLKEGKIDSRLKNLIRELMICCASRWLKYNIKDVGQFYYIKSIAFSNTMAVLSQAGEGSIQELFKTTVQENRNISTEKREPGKLRRALGLAG